MKIITKRISEISTTQFNDKPSSAKITLTEELKDMGIDLVEDKVVVSLIDDKDIKKIVIEKIIM